MHSIKNRVMLLAGLGVSAASLYAQTEESQLEVLPEVRVGLPGPVPAGKVRKTSESVLGFSRSTTPPTTPPTAPAKSPDARVPFQMIGEGSALADLALPTGDDSIIDNRMSSGGFPTTDGVELESWQLGKKEDAGGSSPIDQQIPIDPRSGSLSLPSMVAPSPSIVPPSNRDTLNALESLRESLDADLGTIGIPSGSVLDLDGGPSGGASDSLLNNNLSPSDLMGESENGNSDQDQLGIEELPAPANTVPDRSRREPVQGNVPAFNPLDALPPSLLGGQRPKDFSTAPAEQSEPEAVPLPDPSNSAPLAHSGQPNDETQTKQLTAKKSDASLKYNPKVGPIFAEQYGKVKGPASDVVTKQVAYDSSAFLPSTRPNVPNSPFLEESIYRGKFPVPVQRPLLELGRPLYTGGIYDRGKDWFGKYNLVMPHFMVYGDFRTGVGVNRNSAGDAHSWASRLNLDMDLEITATERIHAFMGPLDRAGDFTRLDFTNDIEFVDRTDIRLDTLFFEGDAGAILGGLNGTDATFDLPFSFGFLPLFYQNGIWAADNVLGAAFSLPARHSNLLKWSNYDATFFWASDQINSDAFPGDDNAAEFFGTAWFIEAYDGYIEADYAFVHDDVGLHRSYHNFSVAFTRRYFHRISNTVRFITNFDQSLPRDQRTAEGHLLLIENSLISSHPNTFVPYFNFFYGQGRTQSLARAGGAGGILNNTGINFETDGLTGYPTLDATAVNTTGGAIGLNMLGNNFSDQLILEFAALAANGSAQFRNARGDQYAVGARYQKPLNHRMIFRTDAMYGFLRNARDINGSRVELRWKF